MCIFIKLVNQDNLNVPFSNIYEMFYTREMYTNFQVN